MPKKNKQYNCPYELNNLCDLTQPCLGCETWSKHYNEFNKPHTQPVIGLLEEMKEYFKHDTCASGIRIYNKINNVLKSLTEND